MDRLLDIGRRDEVMQEPEIEDVGDVVPASASEVLAFSMTEAEVLDSLPVMAHTSSLVYVLRTQCVFSVALAQEGGLDGLSRCSKAPCNYLAETNCTVQEAKYAYLKTAGS